MCQSVRQTMVHHRLLINGLFISPTAFLFKTFSPQEGEMGQPRERSPGYISILG